MTFPSWLRPAGFYGGGMVRGFLLLVCLGLLGCGPAEPPAPVVPVKPDYLVKREKYFGAAVAADPAIDWRSTGLGVKILVAGEGPAPGFSDQVRVHYTGTLADGTVFDDTRAKGQPSVFAMSRLLRGMVDGLGFMKAGGRALLYVPPSLGYGSMQVGDIPPVSGLIFDLELIEVVPPK